MKSLIKTTVVTGVILMAFSLMTSSAFAQSPNRTGWSDQQNNPHVGPPSPLSQRPEFDGDIHKFRQEIRTWIDSLREWIKDNWRRN